MKNIIKLISIDYFEEFSRINLLESIESLSFSPDKKNICVLIRKEICSYY